MRGGNDTKTRITVKLDTIDKVNHFTGITMKFESSIDVIRDSYRVDGKSALGILTMDLRKLLDVEIHSCNEDEIKKFNEVMEEFRWEQ